MSDGDATASWQPSPDGSEHSAHAEALHPGVVVSGRFLLHRVLGMGGSGRVFEATDMAVGQRVALKVLHAHLFGDRNRERVRREVRLCRQGHPHAITVYDLHGGDDLWFVTMELVDGPSLRRVIDEGGPLEIERLVRLGAQLADALDFLHQRHLVHRDVKPGNVLLTADGDAKLCDMGLLRSISGEVSLTQTDVVLGTPSYMAPEQLAGGELTTASDVYALGLTLAQALTGDLREAADTRHVLRGKLRHRPASPRRHRPDCPRWLDRLVRRMTDPDPRERPSAARVRHVLQRRRLAPRPRRRQVMVAVTGLLVAAVCGVVAGTWYHESRRADRVDAADTTVRGVDREGNVLWRRSFRWPVKQVTRGDLTGDGLDEAVAVTAIPFGVDLRDGDVAPSEITVLDAAGGTLSRVRLPAVVGPWSFPYPAHINGTAMLEDLDDDGFDEVVVVYQHVSFYPSGLVVYWPSYSEWQPVLQHPGRIFGVTAVPGSGRPTLQFFGVNNRLGMAAVVGEIQLTAPSQRRPETTDLPLTTLELTSSAAGALRWVFYTPVAELTKTAFAGHEALHLRGHGPERVSWYGDQALVDAWGNPVGMTHVGRDLRRERSRLWQHLLLFSIPEQADTSEGVEQSLALLRADAGPLLDEPALGVIIELAVARALARSGSIDGGLERLRRLERRQPWDEVRYRLAHLEAVAGRYPEAVEWCRRLIAGRHTYRGGFDAVHLLLRLAVATHDQELTRYCVSRLVTQLEAPENNRAMATSVWARCRLWWDQTSPVDVTASSREFTPAGDALACLARWRLGLTRAEDPEAMAAFADAYPDAENEGRLAQAAALLALDRPAEAVEVLDSTIIALAPLSRDDFLNQQLLELARALHATAMAASGERDRAIGIARQLATELDQDLLPGRLAHEVLATTDGRN